MINMKIIVAKIPIISKIKPPVTPPATAPMLIVSVLSERYSVCASMINALLELATFLYI